MPDRADAEDQAFYSGVETAGSSPEEFAAVMKSYMATTGKVIKNAGIRDK